MAVPHLLWLLVAATIFQQILSSKLPNKHHFHEHCPVDCRCTKNVTTTIVTLHCSSLNFVNKLTDKQSGMIVSLDLSNNSIHTLDKRLKYLTNIEWLNLSQNKLVSLKHLPHLPKLTHLNLRSNLIKNFSAKRFPISLRHLDISHNLIKELPEDLTRLQYLRQIDIYGNPFSCNEKALDIRDSLLEQKVHFIGKVLCTDPPKLKGHSWMHAIDFDEYFKTHDDEMMLKDQAEDGSGDNEELEASGDDDEEEKQDEVTEPIIIPIVLEKEKAIPERKHEDINIVTSTESEFIFDGSGTGELDDLQAGRNPERIAEASTITPLVNPASEDPDKHANLGTNIFLGVFLLCLVSLLIYAVKKNKERKREARRKRRNEKIKEMEMMPKNLQRKPSDKQNGTNPDSMPFINGQNGNSKSPDTIDSNLRGAEEETIQKSTPLLNSEKEPANGDYTTSPSAPIYPDVKSVKVKASEIPDSVPQTPVLVTRNRSSDGRSIVVTPKPNQRNTSS